MTLFALEREPTYGQSPTFVSDTHHQGDAIAPVFGGIHTEYQSSLAQSRQDALYKRKEEEGDLKIMIVDKATKTVF